MIEATPEWLDVEAWQAFKDMRKANGKRAQAWRDRVFELLTYSPDTGLFHRKIDGRRDKAGTPADRLMHLGYCRVSIDGVRHYSHRIAWLMMTGAMADEVDHINGVKSDNRWVNLREADRCLNMQNLRTATARSSSGFLGVTTENGRYRAAITVNGVNLKLGRYATPEEAHAVYLAKKRELHEGCTI